MKIVYTIAGTYRPAGMERILTDKANFLAGRGYDVTIVTTEQKGRPDIFPLLPSVHRVDLAVGYEDNNGGSLFSKVINYPVKKLKHKKRLRRVLTEINPDVTISMFCGDESFLPGFKCGGKKILEVHFSRYKRLQYGRKGFWALADRYRSKHDLNHILRFDRFVCLTEEDFGYWGHPSNGRVIPNFIDRFPSAPSSLESKTVLAVGRYDYQKGFERLVEAWKIVCDKLSADKADGESWKLRIVGDGPLRGELQKLVERLGLSGSAVIDAPSSDMASIYCDASIYALSSRYEGLPMVLLEAQSYGIPIVAFDCKCGPKDVVSDGKDGLLVKEGDVEALADALLKLMTDKNLLEEMGRNAFASSRRWSKGFIMDKWMELFDSL